MLSIKGKNGHFKWGVVLTKSGEMICKNKKGVVYMSYDNGESDGMYPTIHKIGKVCISSYNYFCN